MSDTNSARNCLSLLEVDDPTKEKVTRLYKQTVQTSNVEALIGQLNAMNISFEPGYLALLASEVDINWELLETLPKEKMHDNEKMLVPANIVKKGEIQLLEKAEAMGYNITLRSLNEAAKHGFIHIIDWLHNRGIRGDALTCSEAIHGDKLDTLKYLVKEGYQLKFYNMIHAAVSGNVDFIKYLLEINCPRAIKDRKVDGASCEAASRRGFLDELKFMHENGFSWDHHTCDGAAFEGKLNTLQYAVENGCPYDKTELLEFCRDPTIKKWVQENCKETVESV